MSVSSTHTANLGLFLPFGILKQHLTNVAEVALEFAV